MIKVINYLTALSKCKSNLNIEHQRTVKKR